MVVFLLYYLLIITFCVLRSWNSRPCVKLVNDIIMQSLQCTCTVNFQLNCNHSENYMISMPHHPPKNPPAYENPWQMAKPHWIINPDISPVGLFCCTIICMLGYLFLLFMYIRFHSSYSNIQCCDFYLYWMVQCLCLTWNKKEEKE